MKNIDCIIIGGGPSGLSAASSLFEKGIKDILIVERENYLGGILRQCIHNGFGLDKFGVSLTGPEYAHRYIELIKKEKIPYLINTTVTDITQDKKLTLVSPKGIETYKAKSIVLAMGCSERTRGQIGIPGERPAGVFTAGVAQAYMNLYNKQIGKKAIILGSGDIGLIMARRLTLEGVDVQGVFEIQPYVSGLPRNVQQCLEDYNIPLHLSHTVVEIHGSGRLKGVTICEVDENLQPKYDTKKFYECDTLILSVGLLPENNLSANASIILDNRTKGAIVDEYFQTNINGIFASGNVLQVHDLVDYVSLEAEDLSNGVTKYLKDKSLPISEYDILPCNTINHTIPQKISCNKDFSLSLRVKKIFKNCKIQLIQNDKIIFEKKFKKAIPAEMIKIDVKKDWLSKGNLEVKIYD